MGVGDGVCPPFPDLTILAKFLAVPWHTIQVNSMNTLNRNLNGQQRIIIPLFLYFASSINLFFFSPETGDEIILQSASSSGWSFNMLANKTFLLYR